MASSPQWRTAAANARLARQEGDRVCMLYDGATVELWDTQADHRMFQSTTGQTRERPADAPIDDVVPWFGGCLALLDGRAVRFATDGAFAVLSAHANAIAPHPNGAFIVEGARLITVDHFGLHLEEKAVDPGITAVTVVSSSGTPVPAVGFADGSLALLAPDAPVLRQPPRGRVVRLAAGPRGTLVAGTGRGFVGLWDLRSGARVDEAMLHGAVQHIVVADGQVSVASELGDVIWDLGALQPDLCALRAEVARDFPVLWENGRVKVHPSPPICPPLSPFRMRGGSAREAE
jgi:hypothetical protein